jgi:transcriptional antiterminator RfaH
MPLVPLDTCLFPDDLLAAEGPRGDARWWVLHTRPRAEKRLARQLVKHQIAFYLPLFERRWRHRGRAMRSQLPLFPGYVFLRGDTQARLRALETNLVVQTLHVGDEERLRADLHRVRRLIDSGLPLLPEEKLRPGQPVEIIGGPLRGMQGKILRKGKECTFVVEVDFLQRGASIEIDFEVCKPIGEPPGKT